MFAHADIDHVRIAFSNRHRTDGSGLEEPVRDISPTDSHVIGFPEAAAGRAHVIGFGVADDSSGAIRTTATKRANRSPFERFKDGVVIIWCGRNFYLSRQIG